MSQSIQQLSNECQYEHITIDNVEFKKSYQNICDWIKKCNNDEFLKNNCIQKYNHWIQFINSKEQFLNYIHSLEKKFNHLQNESDYSNLKNYKINRNGIINDLKSALIQLLNTEDKGYNMCNYNSMKSMNSYKYFKFSKEIDYIESVKILCHEPYDIDNVVLFISEILGDLEVFIPIKIIKNHNSNIYYFMENNRPLFINGFDFNNISFKVNYNNNSIFDHDGSIFCYSKHIEVFGLLCSKTFLKQIYDNFSIEVSNLICVKPSIKFENENFMVPSKVKYFNLLN